MRLFPDRLGPRINLFLFGVVLLLGAATAGLIIFGFDRSQQSASSESEEGVERFAEETLASYAEVVAQRGNADLSVAGRITEMLARTYLESESVGASGQWSPEQLALTEEGARFDPRPERPSDLWLQSNIPLSPAEEEFRRSAVLDAVFPGAMREIPQAIAVYFIGANGAVRYHPPVDLHTALPADGDIHEVAVGYLETAPELNPNRRTIWVPPYDDPAGRGLMISALTPVWDGTDFLGVAGIDLSLDRLVGLINNVRPSDNGYAFMLGSDGEPIPSAAVDDIDTTLAGPDGTRLAALLERMRDGQTGVERLNLGEEEVFVAYAPMGEVGGSLGLVAPIADVRDIANTDAIAAAIDREGQQTLIFTIIVLACMFIVAIAAAAIFNARMLIQPIGAIVAGTRRVAAGDLSAEIPVRSTDELGILAQSFNEMTAELVSSRARIEERNAELEAEISERLRVEEDLRRSEELYRTLARNLPGGVVLLFDHDLRYTIADGAGLAPINMSSEQLVGRTVDELFEAPLSDVLARNYRAALRGETMQFEVPVLQATFLVHVTPLRDADDNIFAGMALALDITERKRAEQEIHEKEEQYRSIFQSATEALFITDMDDVIVDANPASCELFGYTLDEMPALPPFTLVESSGAGRQQYLDTLRSGREYRTRTTGRRKDGATFPVDVLGTPVTFQGTPHILSVMRDVTEQVEAERMLERRVTERTRELASLLEVARGLTSQLDVDGVVQVILRNLNELLDSTGSGVVTIDDGIAVHRGSDSPRVSAALESGEGVRYPMTAFGPVWESLRRGEAVVVEDVRGEGDLAAAYRTFTGDAFDTVFADVRAWMAIPMMTADEPRGVIFVSHDRPAYFEERHVELARAIANQAAVAIENARLYEQTREQTEQLTALLGVSQSITSTIELEPLLQVILDQIAPLVDSDRSAFMVLDDGDLVMRAISIAPGTPNADQYSRLLGVRYPTTGTQYIETMRSRQPMIVTDVLADEPGSVAYRQFIGEDVIANELLGMRAWMGIPLVLQDRVIGMLALSNSQPGYFGEAHAQLASAIANQAAVAVENAALYERTRRQTQELSALLEISHSVASTLERGALVATVLEQLRNIVDYHGCTIFERTDDDLVVLEQDGSRGAHLPVFDTPIWRSMLERVPVIVKDIHDHDDPAAREFRLAAGPLVDTALRNGHSWIAVPIALPDRVIGVLTISHAESDYFTPEIARTLRAVADQFAIAIENARLYEESTERAREMSALLEVSHAVTSTLELDEIVGLVLDQLRVVVQYTGSSILIADDDGSLTMIETRVRDEKQRGAGMRFPTDAMHPIWSELLRLRPVIIDDVRGGGEFAAWYRSSVGDQLLTMFEHVRSWIAIPLAVGDKVVGFISCSRDEPGYFTERHVQIARAVADQAALAMENARLFGEAQRRAREMEALFRADRELFRSLSLKSVFQALTDVTVDVLDVDKSLVFTIDRAKSRMEVQAHRNIGPSSVALFNENLANSARNGAFPTITAPEIFGQERYQEDSLLIQAVVKDEGVLTSMDVPITAGDELLGVFIVAYTRPHEFTADEKRLMLALADRAAIAIQNAGLYERAQQVASLEERQRLARELHDSVSQALYGIALGARTARTQLDRDPSKVADPIDYVLQLAEAGLTEMRALIFELRPESLETEGVVAAIEKQVAATRARHNLDVHAELCPEPNATLDAKEAVYRITQEALHNVVKHARATHVDVQLECDDKEMQLRITDNGTGFDPGGSFPGHIGLRSMQERASKVGGSLDIQSTPGKGASICAHIPVAP